MNPKWLVPICLVLGLTLLGLAGATKPLQRVQLWLDQRDSPHTAAASALAPIIDCVNRVDRDTRLAYFRMNSHVAEERNHDKFGDNNEPEPRIIQAAVCSQLYTLKLEQQQPGSRLAGLATVYAYKLHKFTTLADMVNPIQHEGLTPTARQIVAEAMNKHLAGELAEKGQDYLMVSTWLRKQLEEEDLRMRPAQLALLQTRFGQDLHWHLLNYMIAARQAINQIDQGVHDANLTPQALAKLIVAVQRANENSTAFVDQIPNKQLNDETIHLWYSIKAPADTYLNALHTLLQDWLEHAPPQQLSDDYYLVTRRYDALLSYYNKSARNAF